jgi:hypothetical protein
LEVESQVLIDHFRRQLQTSENTNDLERSLRETELDRYLRRHSAGDGQFFLGPIPDAK